MGILYYAGKGNNNDDDSDASNKSSEKSPDSKKSGKKVGFGGATSYDPVKYPDEVPVANPANPSSGQKTPPPSSSGTPLQQTNMPPGVPQGII